MRITNPKPEYRIKEEGFTEFLSFGVNGIHIWLISVFRQRKTNKCVFCVSQQTATNILALCTHTDTRHTHTYSSIIHRTVWHIVVSRLSKHLFSFAGSATLALTDATPSGRAEGKTRASFSCFVSQFSLALLVRQFNQMFNLFLRLKVNAWLGVASSVCEHRRIDAANFGN